MKRRMDTLKKGDKFTCASGRHYTFNRRDGALSGVFHVIQSSGYETFFAGCAEVEMGWNDVGWFAKERNLRLGGIDDA